MDKLIDMILDRLNTQSPCFYQQVPLSIDVTRLLERLNKGDVVARLCGVSYESTSIEVARSTTELNFGKDE